MQLEIILFAFLFPVEGAAPKETEKLEIADIAASRQHNETIPDKVDGSGEPKTEVKLVEHEIKKRDDRVSNLQLENRLLKGEIASLNEELANSIKHLKEVEEGL